MTTEPNPPRHSALAPPAPLRIFTWPRALVVSAAIAVLTQVDWDGQSPRDHEWLDLRTFPAAVAALEPPSLPPEAHARAAAFVAAFNRSLSKSLDERLLSPSSEAGLDETLAMLDAPGAAAFLRQHFAQGHVVRAELRAVRAAIGTATLVELVLVASAETPVQLYAFAHGWLEPRAESWVLREHLPHRLQGSAAVTAVSGELRVDAEREWLEADLQLTVRTDGQTTLAFGALAGWSEGTMQWEELSQAGAPCRFTATPQLWLVQLPNPSSSAILRLRYRGRPGPHSQAYLLERRGFFSDLVPRLVHDRPAFDVRVTYREQAAAPRDERRGAPRGETDSPRASSLLSSLRVDETAGEPGTWQTAQLRAAAGAEDELAFALAPFVRRGEIRATATTATIYEADDERRGGEPSAGLAVVEAQLNEALRRLAPLGPLPVDQLRIALLQRKGTLLGQLVNDMIVIGAASLQTDDVLAHELAHLWFGHRVGNAQGEAARWSEAVAEYVSLWALDPAWAAQRRAKRLREYEIVSREVALDSDAPLAKRDSDALSYGKAELLFEALEVQLGKPAVVEYLRLLAERHHGRIVGWPQLVELLAERHGAERGAWMREWITRPGAPSLELSGQREGRARFRGAIEQLAGLEHPAGEPAYRGVIQVSVDVAGQAEPVMHPIELTGRRTDFSLDLPAGALRVQLDPLLRFPRRRWITTRGEAEERGADTPHTVENAALVERHVHTVVEL